jgi:hypothetical protein
LQIQVITEANNLWKQENWFYHDLAFQNLLILLSHIQDRVSEEWFSAAKSKIVKILSVVDLKLCELYWKKIANCYEDDVKHFTKLYKRLNLKKRTFELMKLFKPSNKLLAAFALVN